MSVAKVDRINLYLLIAAFVVAYIIPFELLLLSYAFLGPLHYLTEISWLHDRKYFSLLPEDPFLLVGGSLFLLYGVSTLFPNSGELIWVLLLFSFCAAFVRSLWKRLFIICGGIVLIAPWLGSTFSFAAATLIPTVIHVFVFTLLFMLFGALKSGSKLGLINFGALILGAVLLLILPQHGTQWFPSLVADNYYFFSSISHVFSRLLDIPSGIVLPTMASFLSFVYTYHYLNWFSKTSVIEWHKISWVRALFIGVFYAIAVGLYLYDYALGFTVLLALSFLHVVLEFPLNFRSIQGIYQSLSLKK